ncbi:MAG: flavin reductase family protein [Thermodesulfobacteriota bacterium]
MKKVAEQEIMGPSIKQIPNGAFLAVQTKNKRNVMTIGWALFGYVWRRSMLMVAVRNSRFTHGLLEEANSFAVSVPSDPMEKELNFCGSKSGRHFDKFKECALQTIDTQIVDSPLLNIPGYHYQCRLIYKSPMDPRFLDQDLMPIYPAKDYHTLYFGEILAAYLIP